MKKIVSLCDWLPPDFGAIGQYAVEYSLNLAKSGYQVNLYGFTSTKSRIEYRSVSPGFLSISYIYRPDYVKESIGQRALWTFISNIILVYSAFVDIKKCDEIRFTGSPPYFLHFIMPVAKLLNKKTVYKISDFHPEVLIASIGHKTILLKLLLSLTNFWRRKVDIIEVIGEDQKRVLLRGSKIDPSKITLQRDSSPVIFNSDLVKTNAPDCIGGYLIILYSGNWGVAHDYETFIDGFSLFSSLHPSIAGLWINATGKNADKVASLLKVKKLPFAKTMPTTLDQLGGLLLAADIHLITLRAGFAGYVLPSKVYACIESGKPILYIGSKDSDVHLLCTQRIPATNYRHVNVGDVNGVANAIKDLLPSRH